MEATVKKALMLLLGLLVVSSVGGATLAQLKVGYINSDRILEEFEEAKDAQNKLDIEARKLETEYQNMIGKLDSLRQEYERQKMIMSDSRRKAKEQQITTLQQTIQRYQIEKMGPEGEIYQKQAELVGPVLDKIKKVIEKVGKENKYDYIFDTVAGNILYAEPAHDLTDKVLYELKRTQ